MVRLSSQDEAEGLATIPRVAKQGSGGPTAVLVEPCPAGDVVVVKKRALKWVKQQVSALLCGEDLPEGAQAREVAKVLYQVFAVPREACVLAVLCNTPQVDGTHGGALRGEVPM